MSEAKDRATHSLLLACVLLAGGMLVAASGAEAAERGCFASCMAKYPPKNDDYFAYSSVVKGCRDQCEAAALADLRSEGLYDDYAACTPQPLSKEEFRDLRASNPSWQAQFNVFTWDVTNTLPDKILTEIEVETQDMNLINVSFQANTVIAPEKTGTFVVTEFFDGYPAVRYATKVRGAKACTIK